MQNQYAKIQINMQIYMKINIHVPLCAQISKYSKAVPYSISEQGGSTNSGFKHANQYAYANAYANQYAYANAYANQCAKGNVYANQYVYANANHYSQN